MTSVPALRNYFFRALLVVSLGACHKNQEVTSPARGAVTESVYASGLIKSKNQYQVFPLVSGIIEDIFVTEGDHVAKGQKLLIISNDIQRLTKENAQLAERFADLSANEMKLSEARAQSELAKAKMTNDSLLYARQLSLWSQYIGTRVDLEQRELSFRNSKTAYQSALIRMDDLKRQLEFTSQQAKKNLQISDKNENDCIIRSELDGIVYSLNKEKGEIVTMQTPLAVVGETVFILEMQVDEYDIARIRTNQKVFVSLDSYKGKVFEANVTRIFPYMNERSKTLTVEAEFIKSPPVLFPNLSFEANIVVSVKERALLIPRKYLLNDSAVMTQSGKTVKVKTGLRDYQVVEILGGIDENVEIIVPEP